MTTPASEHLHAAPRFPFVARIIVAMVLGTATGWWFGPRAARLGEIGSVIIDLIKALAGPLLFFAVVDAFLRTKVSAQSAGVMVAISLTNAAIAVIIGLTLSNVLQPGTHRPDTATIAQTAAPVILKDVKPLDFQEVVEGYLPRNIVKPFLDNAIITIVILAVLSGAALRRVKTEQIHAGHDDYRVIEAGVATLFRATEVVLSWVISFVPVAVFGVVAKTIGKEGFASLGILGWYVGVAVLGLMIQVIIVYQSWVVFGATTFAGLVLDRREVTRWSTHSGRAAVWRRYRSPCDASIAWASRLNPRGWPRVWGRI